MVCLTALLLAFRSMYYAQVLPLSGTLQISYEAKKYDFFLNWAHKATKVPEGNLYRPSAITKSTMKMTHSES